MTLKPLSALLAATALAGLGSLAIAQDKTGENASKEAAAKPGALADYDTAQKLYAWGVANDSAVAVAAAAEMMATIEVTDVEREVKQSAGEGAAAAADDGGDEATAADLATMLAKAKELAGGDEALLAMVEDIESASSRGRIGGASRTLSRLPAGYTDTWTIPYYGNQFAELAISGDGDADLDLILTDENGNMICYDTSYSDQIYCSWTPRWDGYFVATVKNMGRSRNSYYLLTN